MHEELSTYADEVFESLSEAAVKEAEPSSKKDETELTGSALDKTELERSHLMLWVATGFVSEAVLIILTWIFIPGKQFSHEKCKRYESDSSVSLDQCFQKSKYNRQYKKQYINWQCRFVILVGDVVWHYRKLEICSKRQCTIWWGHTSPFYFRPLERGWRKAKEGTGPPKVPLRQEVVSVHGQRRGQRIVVPVKKLFAREKRPYGLGMVGKLTNRTYRKRIDSYVKRQIEDMDDHRYKTSH